MLKKIFNLLKTNIVKHRYKLVSIISVVVVFLLWYIGSKFNWFNPVFLPSPGAVWSVFVETLKEGYKGYPLYFHIFASMRRLFTALFLAFITAVPLGLAAGSSRLLLAILDPFIEFYRPLPPLAYYTLLVLWFGITDVSKVILLFLSAFAPLFITAVFSVKKIPQDRINGCRSLGASKFKLFVYVIFPSCLPDLLTGFRTAVGVAYATLVAAEMVAAVSGIGWMVLDASKFLRNDVVYMGIIIMGIIAIFIDACIRLVLRKISPWIEAEDRL
ncbi:ABC transporter permease subunit [Clostridium kluyveri]|uniref:Taurine ABC transporter permease n=1 Tax=Clostridium kluyveri TaxID=1534 RepID=A0A1L5F974_CLOKL|nr:ABC transporter permease subunit [Clostridium kluyveri]APM39380.1 taurine ABC transporter permease [Clostridium kluyveri]UZQ50426.1 ABC transporter permease subunit [Clostridium kluyveri]